MVVTPSSRKSGIAALQGPMHTSVCVCFAHACLLRVHTGTCRNLIYLILSGSYSTIIIARLIFFVTIFLCVILNLL